MSKDIIMNDLKKYKVICLKCEQSDNLLIDEGNNLIVNYDKGTGTNFLAGRWRKDNQWGWECICGNDNRVGKTEASFLNELVTQGNSKQMKDIEKSLLIDDNKQFKMEVI